MGLGFYFPGLFQYWNMFQPQNLDFPKEKLGFLYDGSEAAARRQGRGTDNLAPAEDVLNKNPSLVALGKNGPRP